MDWLWTWAGPEGAAAKCASSGVHALIRTALDEQMPLDCRLRALDCLGSLQASSSSGYDSVRLLVIVVRTLTAQFHKVISAYAIPLLDFLSALPSTSTSQQPLLSYILSLPEVLSSPEHSPLISSLQVLQPSDAFLALSELANLSEWTTAHLTPLSLALFHAESLLEVDDLPMMEILLAAPLTGDLHTIGFGRSNLGVLRKVHNRLTGDQDLDLSQSSVASRQLFNVFQVLVRRSAALDQAVARAVLHDYIALALHTSEAADTDAMGSRLDGIPDALVWTAIELLVLKFGTSHKSSAYSNSILFGLNRLARRDSATTPDGTEVNPQSFAYDLCRTLADVNCTDIQAREIFVGLGRWSCLGGQAAWETTLQEVAQSKSHILTNDRKAVAVAQVISKADGSDTDLLRAVTFEVEKSWAPILKATGTIESYLEAAGPPIADEQIIASSSADLLALIAPEFARSFPAVRPPGHALSPNAAVFTSGANTASSWAGKVYSQHEFRAPRPVAGAMPMGNMGMMNPQMPYGLYPGGPSPAPNFSNSSRAPSRHVDDFTM